MHRRHARWIGSLVALLLFAASLSGLHAEPTGEAYQRLSRKIAYLTYDDVLLQRTPRHFSDDPDLKVSWEHYQQAMAVEADLAELKILVRHPDAKVRTLALMRLYDMEKPEAFRVIHALASDPAETFPSRYFVTQRPDGSMELVSEPSTVAKVAKGMLEQAALPTPWLADPTNGAAIDEWTGWYRYLYLRATGWTIPIPKDRVPRMTAVRRKIDALPPVTRSWMLLAIGTIDLDINSGRHPLEHIPLFATEEELIAAAKQLGPDALLAFLRDGTRGGLRDPKGDDPSKGRDFIIARAGDFFRKQDAEALRSMNLLVAAADTDPEMAPQWIREELKRLDESRSPLGRGPAVAVLVDRCGDRESGFVVNWFYGDHEKFHDSNARSGFIGELIRRKPGQWKETVRGMVGHPEFERLEITSVVGLAQLVESLDGGEILARGSGQGKVHTPTLRNTLREHFGLPLVTYRAFEERIESVKRPMLTVRLPEGAEFIELSPDGSMVAAVSRNGGIRLFSTTDGKLQGTLATEGEVRAIHFGRTDGRMMTLNREQLLQTWDLETAKEVSRMHSEALTIYFDAIFSSDGGFLVTSPHQGYAVVDLATSKPRWKVGMRTRGDGMFRLSPDDQRLAINDGFGKTIRFFDMATAKPFASPEGHAEVPVGAAFSPDGNIFASWDGDHAIMFWDGKSGAFQQRFIHTSELLLPMLFTSDSRHLICRTDQEQIALFDVKTGIATRAFSHSPEFAGRGHAAYLITARIRMDGKRLFGLTALPTGKREEFETYLECWETSEAP